MKSKTLRFFCLTSLLVLSLTLLGCRTAPKPGTFSHRTGDEIVVAGKFIHTGTPVVLWMDPGGYDAYRVERRFSPFAASGWEESKEAVKALSTPNRYGLRTNQLSPAQIERVRGGGWDLPSLQEVVDQFVIHFDATGTSRQCFKVLHDLRCLSIHFMLDLDGTIYQTLDLKERAWHATSSNTRSVGIEIANIGAYEPGQTNALNRWYQHGLDGRTRIILPLDSEENGIRTPGFVGRPARSEPVTGEVQGETLIQYDFTAEQYRALIKLTATLCQVFPRIRCDYPRDSNGNVFPRKLPEYELENYQGVLGHFHIQTSKVDPGPAFQWEYVLSRARNLIKSKSAIRKGHKRMRVQ